MAGPVETLAIKEAVVVLATAGVVVPLVARLNVNPVLGYLLAGVILGPDALGALAAKWPPLEAFAVTNRERIAGVAEFGIVLLMFMIGLELSFERITTMRRLVFGLGALQVIACGAALAAAGMAIGLGPTAAIVGGGALALSSTAIVVEVLARMKRLTSTAGRASFAVLLFQDLVVLPLLFAIGIVQGEQGGQTAGGFGLALAKIVIAVVLIIAVGRLALRPLFRLVVEQKSTDMFMAACLLVVAATAQVSALAGFSMALGAFIAGLLLAETEYRREIEVTIEPFRGLLVGVFFFFVGMSIDIGEIVRRPALVLSVTVGVLVIKGVLIYALARLFSIANRASIEVALLLAAGGEFAFVVLGGASQAKLLSPDAAAVGLLVASITMAMTPIMARIGALANPRKAAPPRREAAFETPENAEASVLLLGYGRAGQLISSMLDEFKITYNAIDDNHARVNARRDAGKPVYYGDATRPEFLRRCGLAHARAVVISMNPQSSIERIVEAIRSERADILIIARARDMSHARKLHELGVDEAVPETFEASLQLSEALLVGLGAPMGLVLAAVHEVRDRNRAEINRIEPAGRAAARSKLRARLARVSPPKEPATDHTPPRDASAKSS
ncbi:MAG: cation:proton antiporter [Beijerinckiaceae bacterium]